MRISDALNCRIYIQIIAWLASKCIQIHPNPVMRKGNKSGWPTLVFTSSVDDGCIKRNMQNHCCTSRSTIAWLQEGVTSCRRVRVDFDRLKTLKKGERLALLPGHGVRSSAPMSSNLVVWESSLDITESQKLSKLNIISNQIFQLRWPLSSRETLRKRPAEESHSPSPLVRSTTLYHPRSAFQCIQANCIV